MFAIGRRLNAWLFYFIVFFIIVVLNGVGYKKWGMAIAFIAILSLIYIFAIWILEGFPLRCVDANENVYNAWDSKVDPPHSIWHRFKDGNLLFRYRLSAFFLSTGISAVVMKLTF